MPHVATKIGRSKDSNGVIINVGEAVNRNMRKVPAMDLMAVINEITMVGILGDKLFNLILNDS